VTGIGHRPRNRFVGLGAEITAQGMNEHHTRRNLRHDVGRSGDAVAFEDGRFDGAIAFQGDLTVRCFAESLEDVGRE
jgi:hypothetical protein